MESQGTLIFRSFASGSSGNCYYLGTFERGVLLDAGISARTIQKHLREMGLDFANILGVLITHAHADHIRSVGTLGERVHLPIYATTSIHEGIDRNYGVREKLRTSRRYFQRGVPFRIGDMEINTFDISHDSEGGCLGYVISAFGQCFMLATDCGEPNEEMEAGIRMANHLVIEANHDERMLLSGLYPPYLKQRILSDKGHQSNNVCSRLIADNFHDGLRNIFLCHLSQENNEPSVAYQAVDNCLSEANHFSGQDYFLKVLDRTEPSPVYTLNQEIITEY